MSNKMYLIHEDDYIKHIEEKAILYSMMKQIACKVTKLPSNRGNKKLTAIAKKSEAIADSMFRSWGLPASYLYTGDSDKLALLMENELIEPEDAGYYACDGDCCCGDCEGCCQSEDYDDETCESDDEDNIGELMADLSSIVHEIFGDNVSVHIIVE